LTNPNNAKFVCSSLDVAKKIAFDTSIRIRCVTLEGDMVEPGGTLSGGYVDNRSQILLIQSQIRVLESPILTSDEIIGMETTYHQVKQNLASQLQNLSYQDQLNQDINMLQKQIDNLNLALKPNAF